MIIAKKYHNELFRKNPVEYLRYVAQRTPAHGSEIGEICSIVLDDERFPLWSGSWKPEQHHYGRGGLAQHTLEVVLLCIRNRYFFKSWGQSINGKVLFISAIWHDYGKCWDYSPVCDLVEPPHTTYRNWTSQTHKRNIHHISRSAIEWSKAVEKTGLCKDIHDEVLHCILSHHGQREFGSPVFPKTREAWTLHLCDQLSARSNDCDRLDLV